VVLEHLTRLQALPTPEAAAAHPVEQVAAEFHLNRMALLGRRVGEMHRALCHASGDANFDPEPVGPADVAAWKDSVERDLDSTFARMEEALPSLAEPLRAQVAPLLAQRERLRERVRAFACESAGLVKTRFHGDLHLGQVLVAQDDFVIVDFEGEPERSLEERRAKSSVLRDVAGMVRSFSYAAHAALLKREPGSPANEAGAKALADWEAQARHYFLAGYAKATQGVASVPADPACFEGSLALFLLEKALYELRYELANRPDWVEIPLRGLIELAKT
jgi:maltose alpha-D-glucosyltransferase/alpha-amylase